MEIFDCNYEGSSLQQILFAMFRLHYGNLVQAY